MRCHFNLINGIDKIIDQDGIEVRDLEQARNEALKALQELCHEHGEEPSDWGNWVLEATDENGTVLFFIALGGSAQ